jgi:hypothetical protein
MALNPLSLAEAIARFLPVQRSHVRFGSGRGSHDSGGNGSRSNTTAPAGAA